MISVLFVDDEPVLLDIGRMFLERAGDFSVTGTDSARKAIALLEEDAFDAIIADYQMPEMNGIDLLRVVRERYGDIPFLLFTGRGREDVASDAVNIGADFYVQKGGDPKLQFIDIGHKIETAVERRRALIAIKMSEQRFYDIINFLPDATFAINHNGAIIAWNKEIERITGTRAEKMIGKKDYSHAVPFYGSRRPMIIDLVIHPDPEFEKKYPSIHREDNMITAEGVLHLSGKKHVFLARASLLYDQDGKPAGAIESLRDITIYKESEEKLHRIITQLPFGIQIFRISPDGSIVCIGGNPASAQVTRKSVRCVPGSSIDDIFPGDLRGRIREACTRVTLEGGQVTVPDVSLGEKNLEKRYTLTIFQTGTDEVAVIYG